MLYIRQKYALNNFSNTFCYYSTNDLLATMVVPFVISSSFYAN